MSENKEYIIAFDLGTGGCKSSLYDYSGYCFGSNFASYETKHINANYHEQNPDDWLNSIILSSKNILEKSAIDKRQVRGLGISGFSLGMVPLDKSGNLILDSVPIWSDSRPEKSHVDTIFSKIPEDKWYEMTGNGFPASLYTIFKVLWFKDKFPQLFSKTDYILGTKDYINYRLTGNISTDHSYASGLGAYNLFSRKYSSEILDAASISKELFPDIGLSTDIVGTLKKDMALLMGLTEEVVVVSGGVDNSCMALGARNIDSGSVYNSLGSSSWIAVSSDKPLIDLKYKPFVFAHVIDNMYTSATSIFSAGSSFNWVVKEICKDVLLEVGEDNVYRACSKLAENSPIGSRGLIFNPSLSGGNSLDESQNIMGAFLGLTLNHTRDDMIRASLEGIAFGLKIAFDVLTNMTKFKDEMIVVGGGAKDTFWVQMFSDIYSIKILKTSIDQQSAALGAAALVAVGTKVWKDFSPIKDLHIVQKLYTPLKENQKVYENMFSLFKSASSFMSMYGDEVRKFI